MQFFQEIDIQTCTKEDIPFQSDFMIQLKRNDYVQVILSSGLNQGLGNRASASYKPQI